MRVTEVAGEFTCTVCSAFVPHVMEKGDLTPVQHEAPCGRPCAGGGVWTSTFLLGQVHRAHCVCEESDE